MKEERKRSFIDAAVAAIIVGVLLAFLSSVFMVYSQIIDLWKTSVRIEQDIEALKQKVNEQAITLKILHDESSPSSIYQFDKQRGDNK